MRWILFVASLGLGAVLSLSAWLLDCRACDRGFSIAAVGAAGYLALTAIALWRGPNRLVFAGTFFAFGVHALLVLRMAQTAWCWVCAAAAVNALGLAVLAVAIDRTNLKVAGWSLPWSAVILIALPGAAEPVSRRVRAEGPVDGVRVVILERDHCPYCVELRERLVPRLREEFGARVTVSFRSADDFPGVTKTPTVIISRPRDARVIEGLPPYERLRAAVAEALEATP